MEVFALKLFLAPLLVIAASLSARRFGAVIGGVVVGLPVVAGPILLVLALTHGREFGADAAQASLLGLVSLTVFILVYAFICDEWSWKLALPLGWGAFVVSTAVLSGLSIDGLASLVLASASFLLGAAVLPRPAHELEFPELPAWDLPVRALAAAAMVISLTAASSALGPELSGLLAPFPIAISVLAAFAHAQGGSAEVLKLLRGMLLGLFGFAFFCATVAATLPTASTGAAFAIASILALVAQPALVTLSTERTGWPKPSEP
jgi:hypothetical protein